MQTKTARTFHMLCVALSCPLGACPVFVTGIGREVSSLSMAPIFHSISGVHVRIVQQLLPFRSVPGFILSLLVHTSQIKPRWGLVKIEDKFYVRTAVPSV